MIPNPDQPPRAVEFFTAYDIDVNMRSDGNRLWTIVDETDQQPGDVALVVCLEGEAKGDGFGAMVRVHDVFPAKNAAEKSVITFDWLDEHTCHPTNLKEHQ